MPPVPKTINWKLVEAMIESGSTQIEIAEAIMVEPDTLRARVREQYNMDWSAFSAGKLQYGKACIRLEQHRKALNNSSPGNVQMLIWLGKQRLGQKEPETITRAPTNDAQLNELIEAIKGKKDAQPETNPVIQSGVQAVQHMGGCGEERQDILEHLEVNRSDQEWPQG